ncbi:MAG TPA: aspartyl protease family protein [Sandaracinaceae bacterium]
MRHGLAIVCVVFVGCGANAVPEQAHLAGPLPIWTADHSGEPFAIPRVEVALNGHPVDVMVDTGASQHFVLAAAAWAYGVRSEPFDALATDAHGARFEVRLAAPGSMQIPGRPFHVPRFVFLVESHALWSSGVLGGISPQLLAPAGHVTLLDLAGGRLDVVRAQSDLHVGTQARVCPAGNDSRDGWRYVVPVRVAGHDASLLVDTGAQSTTVYDTSPLAPPLLASSAGRTIRVAGAASVVEMRVLDGVPIEIGGVTVSGRVTVGPSRGQCGEDGLLGFDVLRRCRLALHDAGATLRCIDGEPPLFRAPPRAAPEPIVLSQVEAAPACGHSAAELTPALGPLPARFRSPIDAYVALVGEIGEHAARIEEACHGDGFLEARIRPLLEREGGHLRVRFAVDEGRRFTVAEVTVTLMHRGGARVLDESELPSLRTREGRPYRRADVLADARAITDALAARGIRVANAMFGRAEHEDATVDVHFALAADDASPAQPHLASR